jgi:L-malate glycosyltransferase
MELTTSTLPASNVEKDGVAAAQGEGGRSSRQRRVCFVLDSLNIGGTETQAVELARRLDPERYSLTLVCLRARGPLKERLQGTRVQVLEFHPNGGMNSPGGIYQLFRLAAFLRRERFEILHAHDLWANLLGVTAAKMARVPVVVSSQRDLSHLEFYSTRGKKWLRMLQKNSDAVVANANSIRDGLLQEEGFSATKIRVFHNGIDMERFAVPRGNGSVFGQSLGAGKVVVLVGNMHTDVKGHPTLINAASKVVQESPDTRFVFVGDGALRAVLEEKVRERGLERSIVFLGRRNDVPEILAASDIGVLPSKAEGLPNAVLEYLAAGLPTVASNVGGNAEVLTDGTTGFLVPPDNADALADALLRLLRDPALAEQIAVNGREFVRRNFSFERLIEQTDRMYSELLLARRVKV